VKFFWLCAPVSCSQNHRKFDGVWGKEKVVNPWSFQGLKRSEPGVHWGLKKRSLQEFGENVKRKCRVFMVKLG